MFKWIKLFDNQYFGFWALGLVLFAVQEIPYMIMPLLMLQSNPIMNMQESSAVLDMLEKILGSLCIAFMIFIVCGEKKLFSVGSTWETLFFSIAMGVLLLNFFGWVLYFTGHQSILVMMLFIVAMPPLFYVFIGLWRSNTLLTVTGCVFLVVHFTHVLGNLKMGR